jgi:MFS transporter, ACS family, D-galactonate transporter
MTSTTSSPRTKVRISIFVLMWILILVNFIDRSALSISLPSIDKEFHIDTAVEGWILGSFFWTYLLFQLPGGWLLDRFGPRRIVSYAGIVWGLFQVLGGLATGGVTLVFSRLGLGLAEAPTSPAVAKLNANWLPARERARGATWVDMAGALGTAIGGVIVTALIGLTGNWRWAFIITGGLTVLLSVANYFALRDRPEDDKRVSRAELDYIRGDVDPADTASVVPGLLDYARSRSWWGMWLGRLGWAAVWWGIISWTPTYLSSELHFSLAGLGWGTFFVYGCGVVGEMLAGWLTDRMRNSFRNPNAAIKAMLIVSGAGQVIAIAFLPFQTSGTGALAVLAIAVFFNQMGGIYWAFPAWLAPKPQVGTVGGVMNIASSLGGALAPIIMGYVIAGTSGYTGAFVFLAIAAGLYLVASMAINFGVPLAIARKPHRGVSVPAASGAATGGADASRASSPAEGQTEDARK